MLRMKIFSKHGRKKSVPGVIVKVFGSRSLNIKIILSGKIWREHVKQLRPRCTVGSSQEKNHFKF